MANYEIDQKRLPPTQRTRDRLSRYTETGVWDRRVVDGLTTQSGFVPPAPVDEGEVQDDDGNDNEEPSDIKLDVDPDDLTAIDGIGPAYSDNLNSAGIFTYDQLIEADPQKLADDLDVSASSVQDWQSGAKKIQNGDDENEEEVVSEKQPRKTKKRKAAVRTANPPVTEQPEEATKVVKPSDEEEGDNQESND